MKKVLIIGYGSAGRRHAKILNKYFKNFKVFIFTKQKIKTIRTIKKLNDAIKINPDYFIIASETSKHFNQLKFLEKNFTKKKILVEKPLFHEFKYIKSNKNDVYVNYNLRFHPYVQFMKKIINMEKVYDIKLITNSYLPDWRKKHDFKKNYAVFKSKGGGIILDLSHELDFIYNLFKKIKIYYVDFGKKSNLTKDTEDYFKLSAKNKKISISLDLNYFSKNELRLFLVDGMNFSLCIDLKKNILSYFKNGKRLKKNTNYSQDFTYLKTHRAFINGQNKNQLCKFKDALNVLKMIKQIKNKSY